MRILILLFLLAPLLSLAGEVRVAVGMSYDTAVANIKLCGGEDITARKQVAQRSGLYWWLKGYDIQVVVGQANGKVSSLSYWRQADLGISKTHEGKSEQRVKSLTFDREKSTFSSERLTDK